VHVSEVKTHSRRNVPTSEIIRSPFATSGLKLLPEPGAEAEFTRPRPSCSPRCRARNRSHEEIARLHGYDKFPTRCLPTEQLVEKPKAQKDENCVRFFGSVTTSITLSFIPRNAEQFSSVPVIELENPLSEGKPR